MNDVVRITEGYATAARVESNPTRRLHTGGVGTERAKTIIEGGSVT